ncbi:MAG: ABC transporter permease [Elusimicrobiales bacterium]|nr:ABC transporter permease [Elusimicrobiales bacterium]
MKTLLNIILYSIKENFRTKVYLVLILFSIVLVFTGFLLMGLSGFEQPQRVLVNTGITMIEIFCLTLVLLNSIGLFLQDVENKNIYVFLSKPISRTKFIIGKYIGLLVVIMCSIFIMFIIHFMFIKIVKWYITKEYILTLLTIFLKIATIASIALLSTISTTSHISAAVLSLLIWIAGHFTSEFIFIVDRIKLKSIQNFLKIIYYLIPNFQYFNLKDYFTSSEFISKFNLIKGILYCLIYNSICLFITCSLFKKKDL